jgi:hypothetical protein
LLQSCLRHGHTCRPAKRHEPCRLQETSRTFQYDSGRFKPMAAISRMRPGRAAIQIPTWIPVGGNER